MKALKRVCHCLLALWAVLALFDAFPAHAGLAYADTTRINADSVISIVSHLEKGNIELVIPEALAHRLKRVDIEPADSDNEDKTAGPRTHKAGYRILVFEDNNPRSAQSSAQSHKYLMESKFDYRAYVVFDSPYWKVKVGDFKSRAEAENALEHLRANLPSLKRTMRIIRDRIN